MECENCAKLKTLLIAARQVSREFLAERDAAEDWRQELFLLADVDDDELDPEAALQAIRGGDEAGDDGG